LKPKIPQEELLKIVSDITSLLGGLDTYDCVVILAFSLTEVARIIEKDNPNLGVQEIYKRIETNIKHIFDISTKKKKEIKIEA
jgi:hypothetical protein